MQRAPGKMAGSGPVLRTLRPALAVLSLALAPIAGGQQTSGPPVEPDVITPPRYTVELIVFTYSDSVSAGSEIFVPDKPPIDAALQQDPEMAPDDDTEYVYGDYPMESEAGSPATGPSGNEPPAPMTIPGTPDDETVLQEIPMGRFIELQVLEPGQYTLDGVYDRLETLDAYRPILHVAWIQTAPPQEFAPAVRLRALADPPPGLDGSITLYQGRFLHLGVDLALDAAPGDATGSPQDVSGFDDSSGFPPLPVRYHISEVRIVKDGDLRYYDHPRFGVITKVTPVVENEVPENKQ